MLSLRLKQQENYQSISSRNDKDGSLVCDQKEINHALTKFYGTLYIYQKDLYNVDFL